LTAFESDNAGSLANRDDGGTDEKKRILCTSEFKTQNLLLEYYIRFDFKTSNNQAKYMVFIA